MKHIYIHTHIHHQGSMEKKELSIREPSLFSEKKII